MAWGKSRIATFYDKEILKYPTGIEATQNVVIASGGLSADPVSGRVIVEAGTLLVKSGATGATNDVQTVRVLFAASSGTYQLEFTDPVSGQAELTSALPYNETAANIQAALRALPNIGAGNVTVTGPVHNDTHNDYTVTFIGALAGRPLGGALSVTGSDVDAGAPTVVHTTTGVRAIPGSKVVPAAASGVSASDCVGILTHTVEFYYPVESEVTDEPAAVYFHECVFDLSKLINVSGNLSAVKTAFPTCLFQ